MPVPTFIRQQIDNALPAGITPAEFQDQLDNLLTSIFALSRQEATNEDLIASIAYLELAIMDRMLSNAPADAEAQLEYGVAMSRVLSDIFNPEHPHARLMYQGLHDAERRDRELMVLRILRSMHSVNVAFFRNAQRGQRMQSRLPIDRAQEVLRHAIGFYIYAGTLTARLVLPPDADAAFEDGLYTNVRITFEYLSPVEGSALVPRLQLGHREPRQPTATQTWGASTWDLYGLAAVDQRWSYVDAIMQATRSPRIFALQAAGCASCRHNGRDPPPGRPIPSDTHRAGD